MSEVIIPSNPQEREKLRAMLVEMTNSLTRIDAEKELLKETADEVSRQYELPKKLVNKLARTMHKRNYSQVAAENDSFETLYEAITGRAE